MSNQDGDAVRTQPIVVRSGELQEKGEVCIERLPLGTRILKALLVIIFWLVVTFVNLLTPLLHLVTVPLSIILGAYFTYFALKGSSGISRGTGTCPHCKRQFELATGKFKFPISDTCTECHRAVTLSLK